MEADRKGTTLYPPISFFAYEVQFETMTPAHCPLSTSGKTGKNFIGISTQVVAYGYHGGVYKGDSSAPPERMDVQKSINLKKTLLSSSTKWL